MRASALAAPLEKKELFSAKYVPFVKTDKDESYSLDEVIYRSKTGARRGARPRRLP
jgi:hypothetical protein